VQFQCVEADNAALTSNLTVLAETPAIAIATLVAGYKVKLPAFPPGAKRYKGIQYVIAVATTTAGKVTASLGTHGPTVVA